MLIYLLQTAQIINGEFIQVAVLKLNKILTEVLTKYSDFLNVFLKKETLVLTEQTNPISTSSS